MSRTWKHWWTSRRKIQLGIYHSGGNIGGDIWGWEDWRIMIGSVNFGEDFQKDLWWKLENRILATDPLYPLNEPSKIYHIFQWDLADFNYPLSHSLNNIRQCLPLTNICPCLCLLLTTSAACRPHGSLDLTPTSIHCLFHLNTIHLSCFCFHLSSWVSCPGIWTHFYFFLKHWWIFIGDLK